MDTYHFQNTLLYPFWVDSYPSFELLKNIPHKKGKLKKQFLCHLRLMFIAKSRSEN